MDLRYTDDVLLFAALGGQAAGMLSDLADEAAKGGLCIRAGKTKCWCLGPRDTEEKCLNMRSGQVAQELVGADGLKYLGAWIQAEGVEEAPFDRRMRTGWSQFWRALRDKAVPWKWPTAVGCCCHTGGALCL